MTNLVDAAIKVTLAVLSYPVSSRFRERHRNPEILSMPRRHRVNSETRMPRDAREETDEARTLHNCWPGERSSKGCLEKHREHAKSACTLFALILDGFPAIGAVRDWV